MPCNRRTPKRTSRDRRGIALGVRQKFVSRAPYVELLREDNTREGFVEVDQLERIVEHLPENLVDFARFGFLTAWRKSEIATLEWRDVDLKRGQVRLQSVNSKNSEGRFLPLDRQLKAVIERRPPKTPDRAAERYNRPGSLRFLPRSRSEDQIRSFRRAWQAACAKAGLPCVIFHDLRRSGVRSMIKAGVPEHLAMRISGHRTASVFRRYAIADGERPPRRSLDDSEVPRR